MMNSLPVYILSGGRSSRFGHDKALAEIQAVPLIVHQAELLKPWASSVSVIAEQANKYQNLGLWTLVDSQADAGPMGGLQRALQDLEKQQSDWLFLASVDVWNITEAQLAALFCAPRQDVLAIAYQQAKWQPLWALYHRELLTAVNQRLAAGQGALWRLLDAVPSLALDGSGLDWIQINRPIDLKRANAMLPGQND